MPEQEEKDRNINEKQDETISEVSENTAAEESDNLDDRNFPIVGIGASAGGLEALKLFFSKVPEHSGMAYIVIVHMARKQPSLMPELLQRNTTAPVTAAKDGETIQPDHIYVVPPDKKISIYKSTIQLLDIIDKDSGLPIDFFLRSLAQDQRQNAAAVILSGTGTDGTLGVKEVKSCEGLIIVQSEESASYTGMPRSAIHTGMADMVLTPDQMPEKLVQYFNRSLIKKKKIYPPVEYQQNWLNKIFSMLRAKTGHDFSAYKKNTLLRRISRRMNLNMINDHEKYIAFLQINPNEVNALFREFLIGVTSFFRDAPSFEVLKNIMLDMLTRIKEDETFRIWVPGCSTGEEVYSLAMILRECLDTITKRITLQLFGTDIDKYAIDKAREGVFPGSIAADISQERLKRFFIKEGDFFRVRKDIRDSIVFSVHDVLKDPPFSRLNLLCCRNLLIYLDAEAQKKILPLFHYTLTPGGILMLGSSETIGGFMNLFQTLDSKWKIFQRREIAQALRQQIAFPTGFSKEVNNKVSGAAPAYPPEKKLNASQIVQKMLLDQFSPTAVLINSQGNILHIQGRTGKYLETPSGPPTQNILDMAREGLRIELSSAIRTAVSSKNQVTRNGICVKTNGGIQYIDLNVCPINMDEPDNTFLVVFKDIDVEPKNSGADAQDGMVQQNTRIAELEKELQITRESHQITIEELESSNEELKSTNEELQSSNEELQSTNEELESSKEELQSLNEELQTVNAELQSKLDELSQIQDDMRNLLNNMELATIFVDNTMRIKRFTQQATELINLIQTDIGRPLRHVAANLSYDELISDLEIVLDKLTPVEKEVKTITNKWYKMRIIPYRTMDNRIDGAVLTFTNIDEQKNTRQKLMSITAEMQQTLLIVRSVFDINPEPLAVIDQNQMIIIANAAFNRLMGTTDEKIKRADVFSLKNRILEQTDLKHALEKGEDFKITGFEIEDSEGKKTFCINGRIIRENPDAPYIVFLRFH